MNRPSLVPATDRNLQRCILLTLLLTCLLIAATVWVFQKRIQRLRQKGNESTVPQVSNYHSDTKPWTLNNTKFIQPTRQ